MILKNMSSSKKKNMITLLDYSEEEIDHLITTAKDLKRRRLVDENKVFLNKTGVLIFEKPSLRTHISFETAIYELGGHPITIPSNMVQNGKPYKTWRRTSSAWSTASSPGRTSTKRSSNLRRLVRYR
jgi:ornithine carbamoyltransferase